MKKWIIPSNISRYDVISAFKKLDEVDWTQRIKNTEPGDEVYIYVSAPIGAIKYCCEVVAVNLTKENDLIDDREFVVGDDFGVKDATVYMRLKKIREFANDELPMSILQDYGVNGNIQGARSLPDELDKYISGKGTITMSMKEMLMERLRNASELVPDEYDGSYRLLQETVKAYAGLDNLDNLDYRDLNLVYLMVVGTSRHKIDAKKKTVESSNLPQEVKTHLNSILDEVWGKAQNGEYSHSEKSDERHVGMFGTGFYNFSKSGFIPDPQKVQGFIQMCIDIDGMDDDNEIFNRAESQLSLGFKGMQTASASVILHCLKPYVFPILNNNQGNKNIFKVLGVDLDKTAEIEAYIDNARKIKAFRDGNDFPFKNYRVFDLLAREIDPDADDIEYEAIDFEGIVNYLETYQGQHYVKPVNAGDEADKMQAFYDAGFNARNQYEAFCKYVVEAFPDMFAENTSGWINRGQNAQRYFWVELKNKKYKDYTHSISISMNLNIEDDPDSDCTMSVRVEARDESSNPEDYARQNVIADIPIPDDMDAYYQLVRKDNTAVSFGKDTEKAKSEVNEKTTRKVRVVEIIEGPYTADRTVELVKKTINAVQDMLPYYEHIFDAAGLSGDTEKTYWPSLDEYDPGISKEEYKRCMQDPNIVKYENLDTVFHIYQMGGEATCKQIEKEYGVAQGHYNANAQSVARWIADETGCPRFDNGDDRNRLWPILFVGKDTEKDEEGSWVWKLREPLREAVKELDQEGFFEEMKEEAENVMITKFDKNMILYGPPGTGKTYNSVIYAVAICDDRPLKDVQDEDYSNILERYKELRTEGRIAFTTFHQSYGYEEFIEGIKPVMDDENEEKEISYTIEDGVFKTFCDKASKVEVESSAFEIKQDASIWKITIKSGSKNNVKDECFREGNMRIGFGLESEDTSLKEFVEDMRPGDIVLSFKTRELIDGIGIIGEGEVVELSDKQEFKTSRPVQWIATDIEENILGINEGKKLHRPTVARVPRMTVEDIMAVVAKNNATLTGTKIEKNTKPYVFIIDEINRGNISKIFGELITLIETTKRKGADEAMSATLPYSQSSYSVPDNVYILGTMNTADRSIALMDTALRRRFDFVEMMPDSSVLASIGADRIEVGEETLNVASMLDTINARIRYLFDREHTIGHAFFTSLRKEPTIENLADIFLKNIIPLLQEYFYEDYSKIQLVLGDNGKSDEQYKFIKDSRIIMKDLFKGNPDLDLGETKYEINYKAFYKIQSYQQI